MAEKTFESTPSDAAIEMVSSRKEVRSASRISPLMTSVPPNHRTSSTAPWPTVPMMPPKMP